jgi:hypothetical protein
MVEGFESRGLDLASCQEAVQLIEGLHKVKHLFKWGAVFRAKRDKIRF